MTKRNQWRIVCLMGAAFCAYAYYLGADEASDSDETPNVICSLGGCRSSRSTVNSPPVVSVRSSLTRASTLGSGRCCKYRKDKNE